MADAWAVVDTMSGRHPRDWLIESLDARPLDSSLQSEPEETDRATTTRWRAEYTGRVLSEVGFRRSLFQDRYWWVQQTVKAVGDALCAARSPADAVVLLDHTFPLDGPVHLPYRGAALTALTLLASTGDLSAAVSALRDAADRGHDFAYPDTQDSDAASALEKSICEEVNRWLQRVFDDQPISSTQANRLWEIATAHGWTSAEVAECLRIDRQQSQGAASSILSKATQREAPKMAQSPSSGLDSRWPVGSVDGMKRLTSRLTWWPTRPHKSTPAVNAAERRGQPWTILASSTRGKTISASSPRAVN